MTNIPPSEKQILCRKMLCEDNIIRAVERTLDSHDDASDGAVRRGLPVVIEKS